MTAAGLLLACEKGKEAPVQTDLPPTLAKPEAIPAPAPPPPPPPPPLVGEATLKEVSTLVEKWKNEFPLKDFDSNQKPDETSQDYRRRLNEANRAMRQHTQTWRYFNIGGNTAVSYNAGAKFVREQKLTLKWECSVFDVRGWKNGGSEVLCSTTTPEKWVYSAIGYLPKKLKKGDLIVFTALNTSLPNDDDYWKPRLLNLDSETLSFKYLSVDAGTP